MRAYASKKRATVRDVAKQVRSLPTTIHRAKERLDLKTYKKQKKPKRSQKQAASVKPRARKFYDQLMFGKSVCVIMDDETYVKFDHKTLPDDQYCTVRDGQSVEIDGDINFYRKVR